MNRKIFALIMAFCICIGSIGTVYAEDLSPDEGSILVEDYESGVIAEDEIVEEAEVVVENIVDEIASDEAIQAIPEKVSIKNAKITVKNATYSGKACKPEVKVKYHGAILIQDRDYTLAYNDNVEAGTAIVKIKGTGSFKGAVTKTFQIKKRSIFNAKIILSKTQYTYDGKSKKPAVKSVEIDSRTLKKGIDYTVSYKDNNTIGTASVIIKGTGNYKGSKTEHFTIIRGENTDDNGTRIKTGLYKVDGKWKYYEEGIFAKKTGIVKRPDNNTFCFVEDGVFNKSRSKPAVSLIDGRLYRVENGISECKITKIEKDFAFDDVTFFDRDGKIEYDDSEALYPKEGKKINETDWFANVNTRKSNAFIAWVSNYDFDTVESKIKVEIQDVTPPAILRMEKLFENTMLAENRTYIDAASPKVTIEKGNSWYYSLDEGGTAQSSGRIYIWFPKYQVVNHIKIYYDNELMADFVADTTTRAGSFYNNKDLLSDSAYLEFYKGILKQITDALWTDDMTNLDKLEAASDYINTTAHYASLGDWIDNQEVLDEWTIQIDGDVRLGTSSLRSNIYQLQGGFGTCYMAGGVFRDIAELMLNLEEVPEGSQKEGFWIGQGEKSSNPRPGYDHMTFYYIDKNGKKHGFNIQGMMGDTSNQSEIIPLNL